jgi:eukaryotic-like serine/threonine-protein kinase
MALELGQVIAEKYRIVRPIGKGGMGTVYEAENLIIHKKVAVKVLDEQASKQPSLVQRFLREAKLIGGINNDHIVQIHDLGTLPDGHNYLVMEYLQGETLAQRLERHGRMSPDDIIPLFTQILRGLSAAHQAGILHRDLKPDNIFILPEKIDLADFIKIIDFGISKRSLPDNNTLHTMNGMLLGTPYYLAPEVISGQCSANESTDVYSVGVMLYEMVSGRLPFEGDTLAELLFNIVMTDPHPIENYAPHLDPGFRAIISKAIAKTNRYQNTTELLRALEDWQPVAMLQSNAQATEIDGDLSNKLASAFAAQRGNSPPVSVQAPLIPAVPSVAPPRQSEITVPYAGWWMVVGISLLIMMAGGISIAVAH